MVVTLMTVRAIPATVRRCFIALAVAVSSTSVHAAEMEKLETIRQTAETHALAQIDDRALKAISATAGTLDKRLQLKKCTEELETFSTGSQHNIARSTVGVRCNGDNPWTLYVPVTIEAMVDVLFSAKALTRGALLAESDLEVREIALDKLPIGYLSDFSQVSNFELKRPLRAGTALTLNAVRSREIVQQGQEVIIVAQTAGIQVKMTGEALKNGNLGDLIPVKNLKSGRTVEATVLNDSTVSVNL